MMATREQQQATSSQVWLTVPGVAALAHVSERVARRYVLKKSWRGAQLVVREARGPGGTSGKRYEVLLTSLPVALQAKWSRQQPGGELQETMAQRLVAIEAERREGLKKGWRVVREPVTPEEREAFRRLPTAAQEAGGRKADAVRRFDALASMGATIAERERVIEKETDVPPPTLRRWRRLCRGLDPIDYPVALARKSRDFVIGVELSPDLQDFLLEAWGQLTKPPLAPVYRHVLRLAPERGWKVPSYATVWRFLRAQPHWWKVLRREGNERFEQLFPAQRRDRSNLPVNFEWNADGRVGDVYVKWPDGEVRRPVLVMFMESRSRLVVGWKIGKTEGALLIRRAFRNCVERHDVLPHELLFDSGRGFAAKVNTSGAPTRLRYKSRDDDPLGSFPSLAITVRFAQFRHGQSKSVERCFGNVAQAEKRCVGGAYLGRSPTDRPEDADPEHAILLATYEKLIEEAITEYNERPHRGESMGLKSPRVVYEELVAQTPVRRPTKEQLRQAMLAHQVVRLNAKDCTVTIHNNRYWAPQCAELSPKRLYVAYYNEEDLSEPISLCDGKRFLFDLPLKEKTGYRDTQASKDYARAKRGQLRAWKEIDRASRKMRAADGWLIKGGAATDPDPAPAQAAKPTSPPPAIPQLVSLARNLRPSEKRASTNLKESVREALVRRFRSR